MIGSWKTILKTESKGEDGGDKTWFDWRPWPSLDWCGGGKVDGGWGGVGARTRQVGVGNQSEVALGWASAVSRGCAPGNGGCSS